MTYNRSQLANQVQTAGEAANAAREAALAANYPFLAGIIRAAEESLLVALSRINDLEVPEDEL